MAECVSFANILWKGRKHSNMVIHFIASNLVLVYFKFILCLSLLIMSPTQFIVLNCGQWHGVCTSSWYSFFVKKKLLKDL